jgi:DNA mismatch repair protein MutL
MTSQRIHALPLHLANQIAAGEVVERPASVLKELVENSIDAGATHIDIKIEGAGSQLIKVSDNGAGIHPDDLALALSRHATSKIHSSEQLSHIDSLGFRGEALPSIASVSRLTLSSKQSDQNCGWQVTTEQTQPEPNAHPDGTTVEVAELFFNLPARRRFLRSDKTELNHLTTTLHRLALSRFDVGFNAQLSDQTVIKLPAIKQSDRYHQRISRICGANFIRHAHYLEQQFEAIKLTGWVGKQSAHRAQSDVQYFFINGRVIRDRIINHAIRQAYGEALPSGRQAAYVLYLELPLDRVDVNVHPTKHEVRFRDARLVHGLITRAVQEALQQTESESPTQSELAISEPDSDLMVSETNATYSLPTTGTPVINASTAEHVANVDGLNLLHQRYLIINEPEPAIIDLQQAQQYSKQQQLQSAIDKASLTSRAILVPVSVPLDAAEISLVQKHKGLLSQLAIDFLCTSHEVTVRRIPYLLSQVDLQFFVTEIVNALQQEGSKEQALHECLMHLLPDTVVSSAEQAREILAQHSIAKLKQVGFYRKLDKDTLTGLFSV